MHDIILPSEPAGGGQVPLDHVWPHRSSQFKGQQGDRTSLMSISDLLSPYFTSSSSTFMTYSSLVITITEPLIHFTTLPAFQYRSGNSERPMRGETSGSSEGVSEVSHQEDLWTNSRDAAETGFAGGENECWRIWLVESGLVRDGDGHVVHPILCQVFFESTCPLTNTFERSLPRWFSVTNHLWSQVSDGKLHRRPLSPIAEIGFGQIFHVISNRINLLYQTDVFFHKPDKL